MIKEVKNTAPWTYAINDLKGEEIIGTFYEKELQTGFWIKKYLKDKEINYMSNGKDVIIPLIAGLINMVLYKNESVLS